MTRTHERDCEAFGLIPDSRTEKTNTHREDVLRMTAHNGKQLEVIGDMDACAGCMYLVKCGFYWAKAKEDHEYERRGGYLSEWAAEQESRRVD